MANLTQVEWKQQLANDANAVILDVRTDEEVAEGIIPKAIQIDIYKGQGFIYKLEELDKTKNYYVYCRSGARSGQACTIMNQLGFKNAYNLSGGVLEWNEDLDRIDDYFRSGVRVFGLNHAGNNAFSDSSRPLGIHASHDGLSELGELAVTRINALGGVVDVSQMSQSALMHPKVAMLTKSKSARSAITRQPRQRSH